MKRVYLAVLAAAMVFPGAQAASKNRVSRPVDISRTRLVQGNVHRLADPQHDRGTVDNGMTMNYMIFMAKPSPEQQADLDVLLRDQQNPTSPQYHQWLSPEEFGNRFGLSPSDHSKVVSWLTSQGFTIEQSARARNWVAFSGTAGQVSRSLHTSIHRFERDGNVNYANVDEPSVPEAFYDIAGGFVGLNDFPGESFARPVDPQFNSGTSHFLAPEDWATIYNVTPLYKAGFDGTGQGIMIIGTSDVSLTDLQAFKKRYNLPANDPKMILVGTDPGFNGAQIEGHLDLEWSSALAPNATVYFIYSTGFLTSVISAVNLNLAPVMSVSYGACEVNYAPSFYRSVGQQANAQGITWLNASGDSGAGGCDRQSNAPVAAHGRAVDFPAVLPEVTGVGGTQFVEGTGTYWATANSANFGSALSYIPEAAWNESGTGGLGSTGGGASVYYPQPAWQTGPGVPNDNVRHVPDISFSSASHDAYLVSYAGANIGVAGTSASSPAFAGILALLNQYVVSKGFQKQSGLGNINPQLYRLAQAAPSIFHDTVQGDNIVNCLQGSPDCLTGSFGYQAVAGYDMATGLGSVDANALVTQWNTQTQGVTVSLVVDPARPMVNDTVAVSAIITPSGGGTPTGSVSFSASSTVPLGTASITPRDGMFAADLFFPAYRLGPGAFLLAAQYSGDAAFSGGGATKVLTIVAPTGAAGIVPSFPNTVWPNLELPDAQGLAWQTTFSLREVGGVPAMITGFTIDGQAQTLSGYFPSPAIQANSSVSTTVVFRNLAPPVTRVFALSGVDSGGHSWNVQFTVNYNPLLPAGNVNLTATPLTIAQNPAADPSCQWSTQLNVDDVGGYQGAVGAFYAGSVNMFSQTASIFGTTRVDAYGSLQGTLCFGGITPPASDSIIVAFGGVLDQVTVNFAGPISSPSQISTTPASVALTASQNTNSSATTATATLQVGITDKTHSWTATILPASRVGSWLTASQYSGTGPGQITLTANGTGFEPGVYRGLVVIQSATAMPQSVTVPVMFVFGASTSGTAITKVVNPATFQATAASGMALTVIGTNLAGATDTYSTSPLTYSPVHGVTATVNGAPAPITYLSPTQINLQIPYEAGAGWAVVGINNNGQIAGFQFQISPSAPGIYVDGNGAIVPKSTAKAGDVVTVLVNGAGEVSPAQRTAFAYAANTAPASLAKPVLPITVTVGGVRAFVQFVGLQPLTYGTTQVAFIVPSGAPSGVQPVVVTVGGVKSPAGNLTVQ
jgi:uncharacterized protein (TIGR03437 family)